MSSTGFQPDIHRIDAGSQPKLSRISAGSQPELSRISAGSQRDRSQISSEPQPDRSLLPARSLPDLSRIPARSQPGLSRISRDLSRSSCGSQAAREATPWSPPPNRDCHATSRHATTLHVTSRYKVLIEVTYFECSNVEYVRPTIMDTSFLGRRNARSV